MKQLTQAPPEVLEIWSISEPMPLCVASVMAAMLTNGHHRRGNEPENCGQVERNCPLVFRHRLKGSVLNSETAGMVSP